jgi:hypothetical protein
LPLPLRRQPVRRDLCNQMAFASKLKAFSAQNVFFI